MAETWQPITPLDNEDRPAAARRRGVDYVSLVFGLIFTALAVVLMTGVELPWELIRDGGILWALLILGGVALLVSELRRGRSRCRRRRSGVRSPRSS